VVSKLIEVPAFKIAVLAYKGTLKEDINITSARRNADLT
jgi:hypothetical protein